MRETYRLVGLFCMLIIALPLVAADFSVDISSTNNTVLPGQVATYELAITNQLSVTDRFRISTPEYNYVLFVDERPEVAPGETETYVVEVNTRAGAAFGAQLVPFTIRSRESSISQTETAVLVLQNPDREPQQYAPSIALTVTNPDVVDPREDLRLTIHLRNRNARPYENEDAVVVRIQSEDDLFVDEYMTSLGGVGIRGEKSTERVIALNDSLTPGMYTYSVQVFVQGEVVSEQELVMRVQGFEDVSRNVYVDESFFKQTTTFVYENNGNIASDVSTEYEASGFRQLFTTSSHNYDVEDVDDARSLTYQQTLQPQESVTVTYTTNYRLLFVLFILALVAVGAYFYLRSPVVLGKEAEHVGDVDEGKSEIKVRLFIKNRSAQSIKSVRVIDRISGLAEVQKSDSLGTLKPSKVVKKKGQGTLIRWDVDVLEPFEERIITYRVRTPLTLVGDVSLPSLKAKFDGPSGRQRTVHSNEVSISRFENVQ